MRRVQRGLTALCIVVVFGIPAGNAFAGPTSTPGPGECPGSDVGTNISLHAKDGPPNAGPNTSSGWFAAPGTPNTPGQAVKNVCVNGNF